MLQSSTHLAIVNAYILYCLQKEKEGSKILSHKQFRVELTQELLLEAGLKPDESNFPAEMSHQEPTINRLTERHFITTNIEQPNGRPKQRDCVVCSEQKGKGRKTTYVQTVHPADVCSFLFRTVSYQGRPSEIPVDYICMLESNPEQVTIKAYATYRINKEHFVWIL